MKLKDLIKKLEDGRAQYLSQHKCEPIVDNFHTLWSGKTTLIHLYKAKKSECSGAINIYEGEENIKISIGGGR